MAFDPNCRRCPRLADFLDEIGARYPSYHCRPVPPFGDPDAKLLILGLAPGMHGANATGRPFTGDFAGILLYQTLHRLGFSNRAESVSQDDGLVLRGCRISNAVKCLPPGNKPIGKEVNNCNGFLREELSTMPVGAVVIALGTIAHQAVLKAVGLKQSAYRFGHNNLHQLPTGQHLLDSYHCSRYNTQTRRLTPEMFFQVFEQAKRLLQTS